MFFVGFYIYTGLYEKVTRGRSLVIKMLRCTEKLDVGIDAYTTYEAKDEYLATPWCSFSVCSIKVLKALMKVSSSMPEV